MKKIRNLYLKYQEIINYLIVGILTTIVSLVVKYSLLFTILDASRAIELQIAVIISWICAVIFAYVTNRKFVFRSKCENMVKEFFNFVISRVITLIMEMTILFIFITLLKLNSNEWVVVWTLLAQVVITISNYIFSKLFVFKKVGK